VKVRCRARRSEATCDDALGPISGGDRSDLSDRVQGEQTSGGFEQLAFPCQSWSTRGGRRLTPCNIGFPDASISTRRDDVVSSHCRNHTCNRAVGGEPETGWHAATCPARRVVGRRSGSRPRQSLAQVAGFVLCPYWWHTSRGKPNDYVEGLAVPLWFDLVAKSKSSRDRQDS